MSNAIIEYFDALERLKKNEPINIPVDSKINNDTVALEAGRQRGTIKKSREMFTELIEAIDKYNKYIQEPTIKLKDNLEKYKVKAKEYRDLYEEALNRELMLLEKINKLEKNKPIYSNNI